MLTEVLHPPDAALAARGLAGADPDVARLDDVAARDRSGIRHWAGTPVPPGVWLLDRTCSTLEPGSGAVVPRILSGARTTNLKKTGAAPVLRAFTFLRTTSSNRYGQDARVGGGPPVALGVRRGALQLRNARAGAAGSRLPARGAGAGPARHDSSRTSMWLFARSPARTRGGTLCGLAGSAGRRAQAPLCT